MYSTIRPITFKTLLLTAMILNTPALSSAQESDVDAIAPTRITQGLITRSDLNRLMHQPQQDRNPLRRTLPQPERKLPSLNQGTFQDPNVRPASWQEEQPPTATTVADYPPHQPDEIIGPMPSFEMESRWGMLDMLAEISIKELQEEIAKRRSIVNSSITIDEDSKKVIFEQIEIAETAVQQATLNIQSKADYQERAVNLPADLERLRLASKQSAEPAPADRTLPVESMQVILRNLQTELDHEKSKVNKVEDLIHQRDDRMAGIPVERRQSRSRVDELHDEFLRKQAKGTEDIEVLLALRARELEANTKIQLLDSEASWHDQSQEKLPLEKAIYQQNFQRLEKEVNAWNMAIANRKRSELEEQIRLARQNAIDIHPALKEFSEETTKLAQARAELAKKIGALQNEKLKVGKQDIEVNDQYARLEKSIRKDGKDQSRELLIEVHRNLIRPYEGMARVREIASEKTLTGGTITKLRAQRDKTNDPETFIREQLNIVHDEKVADTTLIAMAEEAIESYRNQLNAIIGDNEQYQNDLTDLQTQREPLLKKIKETRELVDTHALWVQSADPFSVELITKSGQGAQEFFDYGQWHDLGDSIINRVTHRPYECVVGMIGLLTAFVIGRRFKG